MTREEALSLVEQPLKDVKRVINDALSSDVELLSKVNGIISSHSGKMLRPIIAVLTSMSLGELCEDSIKIAAASEVLHNATLIHDDVADNSYERRGYPTLLSTMGPSSAVLVGDFWLAKAVELFQDIKCGNAVLKFFSKTLSDLAEGEMLQLEKSMTAQTSEEDYFRIIYCKTASLFYASSISAAVSVGADEQKKAAAGRFGSLFGISFQIKDDIFDYVGTPGLGKPAGIDLKERKITLPFLGALKNCPEEEERMRSLLLKVDESSNCETLRKFVLDNGGVEYAESVLREYSRKASLELQTYPDCPARDALEAINRFNIDRQS